MLRSILIGVDGSAHSSTALELGLRWARRFDALIVGLGIVDEPTIVQPEMVPLGASAFKQQRDEAVLKRARHQVEQFLERFALRCAEAKVAHKLLEDEGLPYQQIVQEAQRYDLILLGQQTYFRFATQEGPCETLPKVLKNTPRPVVTVPEMLGDGASVVIAYDGSLQAARALHAFQASGLGSSQEIHVVSVSSDHVEAARHADRAVEFLRFHEVLATPHVVSPEESVADALQDQARQLHAGMLVMGAYGQPTLREFFLGSVTRSLLNQSTLPLFLYH
jgi:nucleotide-binding universal stress UspA family protein